MMEYGDLEYAKSLARLIFDLVEKEDYEFMASLLLEIDFKSMSPNRIVCWVRYTARFRDKLQYYNATLAKARLALRSKGLDPDELLHGLNND